MDYIPLTPEYDAAVADLIRTNLKAHHLDIPGTVYFDDGLDHISALKRQQIWSGHPGRELSPSTPAVSIELISSGLMYCLCYCQKHRRALERTQ